tara:strand:+ start:2770 stop:3498 length:729 start_codon:yes stop_codon:yes gene_type:complete
VFGGLLDYAGDAWNTASNAISSGADYLKQTLGSSYDSIMGSYNNEESKPGSLVEQLNKNEEVNKKNDNSIETLEQNNSQVLENGAEEKDDDPKIIAGPDEALPEGYSEYKEPVTPMNNLPNINEPGFTGGHTTGFQGPWSPKQYDEMDKRNENWKLGNLGVDEKYGAVGQSEQDKTIAANNQDAQGGVDRERMRLLKLKQDKKQKAGNAMMAFAQSLEQSQSDTRDPYMYDTASIFGKGINS